MPSFRIRPISRYSRVPGSTTTSGLPRCWWTAFPRPLQPSPNWWRIITRRPGSTAQAIPYRQRAGQQALQRSANPEAVQHLTRGLALLVTLPETPVRAQQELGLQVALGPALMATKGWAVPEVEQTYARARALCQQVGETPQLFPTLRSLCWFYFTGGALPTARELGEQLYRLAQRQDAPMPRLEAHDALGGTLFFQGEYAAARTHLEQGIALTDPAVQRTLVLRHHVASGVWCLAVVAHALWCLGFPEQAVRRSQEAVALARTLADPQSLVVAQFFAAYLHQRRREVPEVLAQTEAFLALATEQGLPLHSGIRDLLAGLGAGHAGAGRGGAGADAPGYGGRPSHGHGAVAVALSDPAG